ncbi:MAG TPA: 4Fe-4S dicluster domain-containing protein [Dehalococcoidia bacterium]|nr:4Fe-4S dicluster domain-containing protein [Dehalococcoidia bacterium]
MKKVYVNEEVCIGCHLCEVYCRLRHASSSDLIKAFKSEKPEPLPRLRVEERGIVSFSVRCQQCEDAYCLYACLTGAITRDLINETIKVDGERCVGCWTCLLVCPLGAIKQDRLNKKAVRCDLCPEEDVPVCVVNCPNEALVYMDADEVDNGITSRANALA